ncbi:MATE family efflux transporter [Clostridium saccharoperbutylacetonicum]
MENNLENNQIENNMFIKESVGKLVMKFSIPCIIAILIDALYNVVDQIFIGNKVGYLGNAATNVAFPLTTLVIGVSLLIGNGCGAKYSLDLGNNDKESAKKAVGNAILLSIIVSIPITIFSLIFLKPLLYTFGATDMIIDYATKYTFIIIFGQPFLIIATVLSSIIRADGKPEYSMLIMMVGVVINTILNAVFVLKLDMGVQGSAIATVIGQFISVLMGVNYLNKFKNINFELKYLKIENNISKEICALGFSGFITQISVMFLQIVMNNSVKYYGALSQYGSEIPISALGIVMKVNSLLLAIIIGISVGIQPILGFNYGARRYDRVKSTYLVSIGLGTAVSVVAFLLFELAPQAIINIFGQQQGLYNEFAIKCFRIFLMGAFLTGFQLISSMYFQAIGKALKSSLLALTRQALFIIPLMLILPMFFGIEGALYSGVTAEVLAALITAYFALKEMGRLGKKIGIINK